ncbi:BZIP transcription factor [Ceratobasidium theobromae]|uniref:BZIP transcription factor n=1 Tax=Ceratobasidium theobromae TaxID=1582974 RepID=A0A5N5QWL4_9AGAM|nr:BZIP transcription factor [Ceratobasidium theobromae]
MSLAMNMSPTPPSSHRHSRHLHQDTHHSPQDHFSITRVPEPGRAYPLNAVRHSSRDDLSYTSQTTSYPDQPRYSRHLMQSQSDRRSNSPYHHMMNVPQVQQAPLPPPHPPMHDPNARPPAPGVPYDFPQDYPPPNPGPSEFHHPPPMYRPDVNPVPAPPPSMPAQQGPAGHTRPLNNSKRAEQNRKAQRAFRERRDQHVKQLESRSAMLDVALANADEANRRLEDSRILVEQLRAENQALRTALSAYVPQHGHPHSQLMIQTVPIPGIPLPPPGGQPIPPTEAPQIQPGQAAPAPAPPLDPSLPSQTQPPTQDSQLNSELDSLALGYPQPPDVQMAQQPDSSERRSGTPAASINSPMPTGSKDADADKSADA